MRRSTLPQLLAAAPPSPPEISFAGAPEPLPNPGMSPSQFVSLVRAHWKQTLIIAAGATLLAAAVIKILPKSYTAMATLIVNSDMKDPLAGQEFQEGALGSFIATQTELMQSPIVLLPVIDRLKLTEDKNYAAGFSGGDANALREYVETRLSSNVEVYPGRGAHLLFILATASNPVRAAEIVNTIGDVYLDLDRHRVNGPAGERAERYSEQLAELRSKAAAAQDRVTEFRKGHGITDMTKSNSGTEEQALENLEQRLLEAQNLRRSLEAKETGKQITTDEAMASASVQTLRTRMSTQEMELAQLNSTLGPQHPKVIELKSQMAATRRALNEELQTLTENVSTQLARAKALESTLTAAVAEQRTKVLHLREIQDEGTKLTLELESAQSVYKHALDGYDQVLFASVGNYSNVSFINRAVPPVRASKPNKIKLLLLGMAAGLGLGVIIPVGFELLFNRRIRCSDDIERGFGIHVLAELDALPASLRTS